MRTFATIMMILMCLTATVSAKVRTGVAYSKPFRLTKKSACQIDPSTTDKKWTKLYAALNDRDLNNADAQSKVCGKCIKVRGASSTDTTRIGSASRITAVYAKVVDVCPDGSCSTGKVHFSEDALKQLSGYEWDQAQIKYEIAECPNFTNLRG